MEPDFTDEEFEILFSKLVQEDRYITGIFYDYTDRNDLKDRIIKYREVISSNTYETGVYRKSTNKLELIAIDKLYDMLFGDIQSIPLQLNRYFKKAAKYRLEIGK